jgi:hypothetical protein
LGPGCVAQDCETHGATPQRYAGGRTNADRSYYETSSAEGPFLFFPAGRTYRLEHGLSETPSDYDVNLSWGEYPLRDGFGIAESAGNQAIFEAPIDERFIQVRNDTCAEFYLRVTARVAPFEQQTDAGPRPAPMTEGDAQ